jgi:acyl carrier protein
VNETQAIDAIRTALAQVAPDADLDDARPDDRLRSTLDLDSLDFLSLVAELHRLTGIEIPEADYSSVDTVRDMTRYLAAHSG